MKKEKGLKLAFPSGGRGKTKNIRLFLAKNKKFQKTIDLYARFNR